MEEVAVGIAIAVVEMQRQLALILPLWLAGLFWSRLTDRSIGAPMLRSLFPVLLLMVGQVAPRLDLLFF